jgi:hypothetical protein
VKSLYLGQTTQGEFMTPTDIIGFSGVFLLLLAFFLNLTSLLGKDAFWYLFLNLAGSGLACLASVFLHYLPFIILEGVWALVSVYALLKLMINRMV